MHIQSSMLMGVFAVLGLMLVGACASKSEPTTVPEPAPPPSSTPEPVARTYPSPPPASASKPVTFPETQRFTLPNGLTVHVVRNAEVPFVSAQLIVRCGTMDRRHVADFTAAMLGEGTKTRTKAQIDDAIEFVGGSLGASAELHTTQLSSRVLSKDLRLALTLLADEAMNPVFPEAALAKLKEQAKGSLRMSKQDPGYLASVLFDQIAYPQGHPYGQPLATEEELDAIELGDIREFHAQFYRSNNAFVVLAGDVDMAVAQEVANRVFSAWTPATAEEIPPNPLNAFTDYQVAKELVLHVVDRPGSTQTEILLGNLALARGHADWAQLVVANALLGGDMFGRLFPDVREKRGLVYGIASRVSLGQAPGTFTITTRTRTETTAATLAAVFEHVKTLRKTAPSAEEVQGITAKLVGGFALELETPQQIANKVREALVYNLPQGYWSAYRDAIAGVTAADVHDAARKYMHGAPHVVLVGEAEAIEAQVEQALPNAKVVRYDGNLTVVQERREAEVSPPQAGAGATEVEGGKP